MYSQFHYKIDLPEGNIIINIHLKADLIDSNRCSLKTKQNGYDID
jgi:hypothetical protein